MRKTLLKIGKVQKTFITCNPSCSKLCVLCSNFYFAHSFVLRTMILFWQSFVLQIASPNGAFLSICNPLCAELFFSVQSFLHQIVPKIVQSFVQQIVQSFVHQIVLKIVLSFVQNHSAILRAPNCARNPAILHASKLPIVLFAVLRALNLFVGILSAQNRASFFSLLCSYSRFFCNPSCSRFFALSAPKDVCWQPSCRKNFKVVLVPTRF